jgi:hypothetical protein
MSDINCMLYYVCTNIYNKSWFNICFAKDIICNYINQSIRYDFPKRYDLAFQKDHIETLSFKIPYNDK